MSSQRRESARRVRRGRVLRVEVLEDRRLLASAADTLAWPSLSGLMRQSQQGKVTSGQASSAKARTMIRALQTQLTNGPLADLKAGTVTPDGFVVEVQNVVASFNQAVDSQFLPRSANVGEMLKLQGLRMSSTMAALNQVNFVGLSTSTELETGAEAAIQSLTRGPIFSTGTTLSAYATATRLFENSLRVLAGSFATGTTEGLTPAEVSTTLQSEAEAYRSTINTGLLLNNTDYATQVNTAVDALESTARAFASEDAALAQARLARAIVTFDTAVLDTSGLFGPSGYAGLANSRFGFPRAPGRGRVASTFSGVSGTATFGGSATLTARLVSRSGAPAAGQALSFTLNGGYAGTAVTDSSGVATLTGVPTFDPAGTSTGAIVVSFAGSARYRTVTATGDLAVSQSSSTTGLSTSRNPIGFGQTVTFTARVTAGTSGGGTPTGTVTFFDGSTSLGTSALNASGVATLANSTLSVATHPITAVYSGDANFTASTSGTLNQIVNPATNTVLQSNTNPSVFGQTVTFTATVSPATGTGTPSGSVTFRDGTTTLGSVALNDSGVATFSTSTLAVGTRSITASYGGDARFGSSDSNAVSQVVSQASTTTALANNPSTSVFGQSVSMTATVTVTAPGGGTPTGTVNFLSGSSIIGTGTLNAARQATLTTTTLAPGTYSITAVYVGNTSFATSTSSAVSQTVNQAATTTSLTSSANPSVVDQPVTFTATVTVTSPGAGTPTGTVNFLDGSAVIGSGTLNASRIATFTTSALASGGHSITAVYLGDTNFATSTSATLTQNVNSLSSTTALVSQLNPSTFGQSVPLRATVTATSGGGTPTGTVTFRDGDTVLGTSPLDGAGVATLDTTAIPAGTRSITAEYSGDSEFGQSFSPPVSQVVNQAATTTSFVSNINPSVFGQPITFTATVSAVAPGAGTPTGTVEFIDGENEIGSGVLDGSGQASFTTTAVPLSPGPHIITARFTGDANFSTSTSGPTTQTVTQADTTTVLASTPNPSTLGATVTFTATVAAVAPGGGTPTGNVRFLEGATVLGTIPLDAGVATLGLNDLSVGTHSITAFYDGDTDYTTSTSNTVEQVVNAP
ncbi:MAG: Ig-like domain-containing protein [Isosphaeraceae bacterium]